MSQKLMASTQKATIAMTRTAMRRPSPLRRSSKELEVNIAALPLPPAEAGAPVHTLPADSAGEGAGRVKREKRRDRVDAGLGQHSPPRDTRPVLIDESMERQQQKPVHQRGDSHHEHSCV